MASRSTTSRPTPRRQRGSGVAWVHLYALRTGPVDYRFAAHYHPYTDELIERLNIDGLDALLDARYHETLRSAAGAEIYTLGPRTIAPFPAHEIDVADDGPYSIYNWELFFHAPVLIATHLSKNQRFAEAQRWFHYVFDPTTNDVDVPAAPALSGSSCGSGRRRRRTSSASC